MTTLSICIPTHDGRAAVLDRLLGCIEEQLTTDIRGHVEICVSDNASLDETGAVLARRRRTLPVPLVTHRFEHNDGFTPNLLRVVEIATGDFCWLVGSDDLIAPGAIAAVLEFLRTHPDLTGLTLNRYRVHFLETAAAAEVLDPPDELPVDAQSPHVYDSAHAIFANVGLLQDYISTQVFSRRLFVEVAHQAKAAELVEAKHFAHLLLLGRMAQRAPRWGWLPEPLVQHTTGTSALDEDLGHDYTGFQLAVMEGRDTVWSMLFGRRSATYDAVMRKAYLRTGRATAVGGLKLVPQHGSADDLALLTSLTRYFYWLPRFWLTTMPILLVPHRVLKVATSRPGALALARRIASGRHG